MKKVRLQDFLIIVSVFVVTTVLVLGLYPREDGYGSESNIFFINTLMAVPVIIAVYYIVISFRKQYSKDTTKVDFSIQTKVAMAFMLISILPTLPIILFSNIIINKSLNNAVTLETEQALTKAISVAETRLEYVNNALEKEMQWYKYSIENGLLNLNSFDHLKKTESILSSKGYIYNLYEVNYYSNYKNSIRSLVAKRTVDGEIEREIEKFLEISEITQGVSYQLVSVEDKEIIIAILSDKKKLSMIYKIIPVNVLNDLNELKISKNNYVDQERRLPYQRSLAGILLLIVTVAIIFIAVFVSIIISKSITRPILQLITAAENVGEGDFSVRLFRTAHDEITLLYESFNNMVIELKEKRKILLQIEKLKAWNDVGAKLLHEIKNPLTPIRLSAERIRRKYISNNDNLEQAILSGTETIIEEVNSLEYILNEFKNYSRLPEPKLILGDISNLIVHSVELYKIDSKRNFSVEIENNLPYILFDKQLMKQVFINIIKNAVEATVEDGNIEVGAVNNSDKNIVITIKDNGTGISKQDKERLFEPNFSKKENGTGLGLAIVERIISQHGGMIYCESELGKGTEFIILLQIPRRENG